MKPKTTDRLNYSLEGCVVKFLGLDDVIQPDDFIRDLYEAAWLDAGFDTTYKSKNWRGTFWHKVDNDMPAWVGRTYRDFLEFCEQGDTKMMHELARVI